MKTKSISKIIYLIFIKIILIPNFFFCKKIYSKTDYLDFENKGYFLLKGQFVSNFLMKIKNEIKLIDINYLIEKNLVNTADDKNLKSLNNKGRLYHFSIKNELTPPSINLIESFLKDEIILKEIFCRLGFKAMLTNFELQLNHYNPNSGEEGPKLWHRDDDSIAGQLKLFFIINDLDEKSDGYFYFIPRNIIKNYNKLEIDTNRKNFDSWNKFRNTDEELKKIINLDNEKIIYGKQQSELLIIDTNDCYHKGGFIKSKDGYRIMITAVYSPIFNISILSNLYKKSFLYRKFFHILRGIKNRLRTAI